VEEKEVEEKEVEEKEEEEKEEEEKEEEERKKMVNPKYLIALQLNSITNQFLFRDHSFFNRTN
jgi:hypothetical protein